VLTSLDHDLVPTSSFGGHHPREVSVGDLEALYYLIRFLADDDKDCQNCWHHSDLLLWKPHAADIALGIAMVCFALSADGFVTLQTYHASAVKSHFRRYCFVAVALLMIYLAAFYDYVFTLVPYVLFLTVGALEMGALFVNSLETKPRGKSFLVHLYKSASSPMPLMTSVCVVWMAYVLAVATFAPSGLSSNRLAGIFMVFHIVVPLGASYLLQLLNDGRLSYRKALQPAAFSAFVFDFVITTSFMIASERTRRSRSPSGGETSAAEAYSPQVTVSIEPPVKVFLAWSKISFSDFSTVIADPFVAMAFCNVAVFIGVFLFERLHRVSAAEFLAARQNARSD
jgi:hypothetical protein